MTADTHKLLRFFFAATSVFWGLSDPHSAALAAPPSPIRQVFVIVLENEGYNFTFGARSPAPYLSKTLVRKGMLLTGYYGIGHASLDNYIAMISGQAPNYATQSDCQIYSDFKGSISADGQAVGHGCVYPSSVQTAADQLDHAGLSWKSYSGDMGNDPKRESLTCGHPRLGDSDVTLHAQPASQNVPADQYATRHNPFVHFHSIIDSQSCNRNVVSLAVLQSDLSSVATTANFSFITPNLCHDGHDGGSAKKACVNNEPGGLISADAFLRRWVPAITGSPAFSADGLLVITFDEADLDFSHDAATGNFIVSGGDASACCNEQAGPSIFPDQIVFGAHDKGSGILGPGGGRIGAVLLSPRIQPATRSGAEYNHYALLKTVEKIFGLPYLGFAADSNVKPLDWIQRKPHQFAVHSARPKCRGGYGKYREPPSAGGPPVPNVVPIGANHLRESSSRGCQG